MFETPEDRIRQHEAAAEIREAWGIGVHCTYDEEKPPVIDYELLDDSPRAVGEFKWRNCTFGRYAARGMLLAERKWDGIRGEGAALRLPVILFTRYLDGLFWIWADECHVIRRRLGGVNDRDGNGEPEPSVWLNARGYALVEKGEPPWPGSFG